MITALVLACALAAATTGCGVRLWWRDDNQATLERMLQAGNEAMHAGRYDEAVRHFDSGLALSPGHPSFLINKSAALRLRGVLRYEGSIKAPDRPAVAGEKEAAGRDLREAESLANEAVEQLNAQAVAGLFQPHDYEQARAAAYLQRAEALRVLASRFDRSRADEALKAIREYMEVEPDADKRTLAHLAAGQMLLDAGKGERAAAVFREVLAADADDLDAALGLALALIQTGDPAKYREAAPHLARFVERAPEDDPQMAAAREALEYVSRETAPAGSR